MDLPKWVFFCCFFCFYYFLFKSIVFIVSGFLFVLYLRYIEKDPRTGLLLHRLRKNGAKTFLLTNSQYHYTNSLMYACDSSLVSFVCSGPTYSMILIRNILTGRITLVTIPPPLLPSARDKPQYSLTL